MFAVVKYLAIDYLYEKMVKERLAFDCLEIHTPSCLYQDRNYYHDGCFDDDKYRRPWIRVSVDSNQIVMNFPVLDIWKECLYVEDFLEKKPISNICLRIHNKEAEVIPSSNPCSQFDIEETCMLTKHNDKELILTSPLQSNYAPAILKEQKEESLSIEDELIFSDDLTQHAKRLPTLHKLLSRLNVFYVQDPLLNSEGDKITEEDIFRECFAFKESKTPQTKREEQCEVFYKETLRDEEVTVLPLLLRVCSTADFRLDTDIPTSLALKTLLEVTPEMLGDENKCFKITRKDFKLEFIPEIIEASSSSSQEVYANQNRSTLEFSNPERYMPFHPRYLEVPLTPPSRPEKLHGDSLLRQLQPESPSLFSKSILITEPIAEYFEALMWQSEKYQHPMNSLLLAEHQTLVPLCHHLSVTELKTLLSVQEDLTVLSAFEEEDGFNLRENFTSPYTLETLSTVSDNKERAVCTNAEETFTKTNHFQADKWLEEQSSFASNAEESFSIPDDSGTKKDCWSPPKEEMFPPDSVGCPPEQYSNSVAGDSASTENHVRKTQVDGELGKPMQEDRGNDVCRLTGFREAYVETNSISRNKVPAPSELPRKNGDDFDLLSSFIMLRSKQMVTQNEESKDVEIQEEVLNAQEETPPSENHDSPVVLNATVPLEKQTEENEIGSIIVKAAESQFQAFLILEAAAAPVLKELVSFGIYNWSFATLNFDDSRFFLKQQEKVMSDTFKQDVTAGTSNAKDITLSKHAALLHLLVTVRDLLLTCNLNTALGYLSKAKDRYEDFLGCTLDKVWRQLKIVQIAVQNREVNPKITELHHQMSKWVHSNMNDQNKVVIITRMDFDEEIALLINSISTVEGLKTGYLKTERRGTFLESKNVISSLEQYDCVVVHNQHIGPNFPWTCFSSVLEYNYSENSCWIDLCKSMKISYLAFRTAVPEAEIFPENSGDVLSKVQIPYIFLTSEGLLNIPEILQLLESEYNVTFIERSACEALQFFGSTEHYVVMTIDEGTAIIVQNVEELNQEKSSDNIVLRLMVLSLQYTTCWMILYSRERLNSEYSLAAKTLHHLALIYAALVSFAQKTEDFDVKVVLTPGLEETALLVRQIADHTLLISKRHPQEWLDKSWLSVLPSESEKCLLTFPCMNPLVAQVMLRKSSSLEWLLSATFDQLQNLLPEVPEKVLKHFNDVTSLYTLKPPSESTSMNDMVPLQENIRSATSSGSQVPFPEDFLSSFQESSPFTEYSQCFPKLHNSKCCSPSYNQNISCTASPNLMGPSVVYEGGISSFQDNNKVDRQHHLSFPKTMETGRRVHLSLTQNSIDTPISICCGAPMPQLGYDQNGSNTYLEKCGQSRMCLSKAATSQNLRMPVFLKNAVRQAAKDVHGVKKQRDSDLDFKQPWYFVSNKDVPYQQCSSSFLGEFGRRTPGSPEFQFEESFRDGHLFTQARDSSSCAPNFCGAASNPDIFFNLDFRTGEYTGKKGLSLLPSKPREQDAPAEFTQIPQLKKRRLTFEKDPGRSDGQTRLKFF